MLDSSGIFSADVKFVAACTKGQMEFYLFFRPMFPRYTAETNSNAEKMPTYTQQMAPLFAHPQ